MIAREIATRLNAKASGDRKWIARCPSHDDRSPSLSIAEGHDGRTLLFCHAGCGFDAVIETLGIGVHELFANNPRSSRYSPPIRSTVTTNELRDALVIEIQRYRAAHGIDGLLQTNEINAIRATVARRFHAVLPRVQRPLWEGGYGGRERDPAWPPIFEWAMRNASIRLLGVPIDFDETLFPPRTILLLAEDLAAEAMRSLEREARRTASEVEA